jgi:hypothetical protein
MTEQRNKEKQRKGGEKMMGGFDGINKERKEVNKERTVK